MPPDLTASEVDAFYARAAQHSTTTPDGLETVFSLSSELGYGYNRTVALYPGLDMTIFHETWPDGLICHGFEAPHRVQFMVHLSGTVDTGSFLHQDADHSYIGGSGIQQAATSVHGGNQPLIGVDIHLEPQLLKQLFAMPTGELPPELEPLLRGDDWQQVFSPRVTGAIRTDGGAADDGLSVFGHD